MRLTAQGSLTLHSFDDRCEDALGPCTIDLTWATWVDVYALVAIVCLVTAAYERGQAVIVLPPRDRDVATYLARMELPKALARFGAHVDGEFPTIRTRRTLTGSLIEVQHFDSEVQASKLAHLMKQRLETTADTKTTLALWIAVLEAAVNAIEHSQFNHRPVMAGQYYTRSNELVVAIGDTGIGLRESLRTRYDPPSDRDAIDLALQIGVTRFDDDPGRGKGLFYVVERARDLGGSVIVRTGDAVRRITPRSLHDDNAVQQQGTVIGVSVPCRKGGAP